MLELLTYLRCRAAQGVSTLSLTMEELQSLIACIEQSESEVPSQIEEAKDVSQDVSADVIQDALAEETEYFIFGEGSLSAFESEEVLKKVIIENIDSEGIDYLNHFKFIKGVRLLPNITTHIEFE